MTTIVTFQSLFSIALTLTISISRSSLIEAKNDGFSVDLIHRDSPKSPFYNPSLTSSERMISALQRSFNRVIHFTSFSPGSASTDVISNNGEYLMKISIGTPPIEILAIADTGSDLIWTQCEPCAHCFEQKVPIFSPSKSSTYKDVPCDSRPCNSFPHSFCNLGKNICQYAVSYGDSSFSHGNLATERVELGSTTGQPFYLPNTIIGCGHSNKGTFGDGGTGIIGLGGGQVSLISQMGSSIGGKFSYCLVPVLAQSTNSSKMNFGNSSIVSGTGVVSTPIVPNIPDTFYYLTLEAITVGDKRLDLYNFASSSNASKFSQEGNIIIDSGTTLTFLPPDIYNQLESAVKNAMKLPSTQDPQQMLSLCYIPSKEMDLPIITMHFKDADMKLNPVNTFVNTGEMSVCLAFAPAQYIAILGNLAQMNFLVGYDLKKKTVSFKPTDCAK